MCTYMYMYVHIHVYILNYRFSVTYKKCVGLCLCECLFYVSVVNDCAIESRYYR